MHSHIHTNLHKYCDILLDCCSCIHNVCMCMYCMCVCVCICVCVGAFICMCVCVCTYIQQTFSRIATNIYACGMSEVQLEGTLNCIQVMSLLTDMLPIQHIHTCIHTLIYKRFSPQNDLLTDCNIYACNIHARIHRGRGV